MQLKLLFALSLTLFSIISFANPMKNLTLAAGCRLYNIQGENIKNFPGHLCVFLDDGSFVSGNEHALRFFNKTNEVVWEIKGHFHHQINLSEDKQKILALSSEISGESGNISRQDKLLILGLDGKILHQRLMADIMKEANSVSIYWILDPHMRTFFGNGHEISHLNSMYEIPANKGYPKNSFLQKGNIIINGLETGIHILSPDLSKVLHYTYLKSSTLHTVHDVQVNSKGNFLIFNNAVAKDKRETSHPNWRAFGGIHSAIEEIDPKTQKIVARFEATPKEMFYSKACGSIQEVGSDTWLFTHIVNGTYVYSKSKKKILHSLPATHLNDHQFVPIQQVKAWDLSKFLGHWK